ncbi:hypothetical protein BHU72_13965 [Desulfuribacillus stibiiarsenatis]|uniref:Uncharacterized protein n=1 Tax=Desulfuribacillus stibiiarsenatis TaxID=1390249 RepID=A0A1E5L858_9FIRM|nr:hypothetical protein [Desulfuribacillus stibiiarsenatis]OEH86325.1 hypothetical protein BHU72_13965 [Desulfuribacillus stibiiarsenatis]
MKTWKVGRITLGLFLTGITSLIIFTVQSVGVLPMIKDAITRTRHSIEINKTIEITERAQD